MQSWDVDQAMIRQRVQEEHIVWLLRLLHNFINPDDVIPEEVIAHPTEPTTHCKKIRHFYKGATSENESGSKCSMASSTTTETCSVPSDSSLSFPSTEVNISDDLMQHTRAGDATKYYPNESCTDDSFNLATDNDSVVKVSMENSKTSTVSDAGEGNNIDIDSYVKSRGSPNELEGRGIIANSSGLDGTGNPTVKDTRGQTSVSNSRENASCSVTREKSSELAASEEIARVRTSDSVELLFAELLLLLQNSQFMDKVASHLSNDSVLDLSRHVPLYHALLSFVRSIAVTPILCPLLLHTPATANSTEVATDQNSSTIRHLLSKMTRTVNTYIAKLAWKPNKTDAAAAAAASICPKNYNLMLEKIMEIEELNRVSRLRKEGMLSDDMDDEGLTVLVPDIQLTEKLVKKACAKLIEARRASQCDGETGDTGDAPPNYPPPLPPPQHKSLREIYLATMQPQQFESFEMLVEEDNGTIRFTVCHLFESSLRKMSTCVAPRRIKRLAQEAVTLSTSLPLSYSSSVFVRTDTDRLDIMKVLIIGPEDTPYANGLFEFDVYFPVDYPLSPLQIKLQTTGEGRVRFNPNLYQDGKVCLSILNTWHGRPEEKWNSQTSSLLQVLVSIQSLILVNEPYFNEPGYERSRGTASATQHSREYDATVRWATVRWAILNQLRQPSPCFKQVVDAHLYLKQHEVIAQVGAWLREMETFPECSRRTSRGLPQNITQLKKLLQVLKEEFPKLKPPVGLQDVHLPPAPPPPCSEVTSSTTTTTTSTTTTTTTTSTNTTTTTTATATSTTATTTATQGTTFSKPRERKTAIANIMAGLKWGVIDEEVEEANTGAIFVDSSITTSNEQSPQANALNSIAAAVNATESLFSSSLDAASYNFPDDPFSPSDAIALLVGLDQEGNLTDLPNFINSEPDESL